MPNRIAPDVITLREVDDPRVELTRARSELERVKSRLAQAEEELREARDVIDAIQAGEVDAVVVSGPEGDRVFTLKGAEYAYRALVEAMNEAAAILAGDGTILYCNRQLARLVAMPIEQLIGCQMNRLMGDDTGSFESLFARAVGGDAVKALLSVKAYGRGLVPVQVSLHRMDSEIPHTISMVMTDLTESRKWEESLRESENAFATLARQLRALGERLRRVREEERTSVSRDLHDRIGQLFTAIRMDLAWIGRHLPASDAGLNARISGTIELINDGAKTVRRICSGLRPPVLDDIGLAAAIEWEMNEFAARTGIPCAISEVPAQLPVDKDQATTVFRIFQECLTNVARHAEATTVDICLRREDGLLLLIVRDDGKGFIETERRNSLGLLGMQERAQGCGGGIKIESSPGNGTKVTVRVPLHCSETDRS